MAGDTKLEKDAQFGRIPFDLYALDHWDYNAPKEADGEQWKQLVKRYLAIPPIDRRPYHENAAKLKAAKNDGSHPNITFDKIERVLRPFQTNRERNASELSGPRDPIWVRLCYDKALHRKYTELNRWAEVGFSEGSVDWDMIMDDEELYDLDDDADRLRERLLERMPGLCDKRRANYRAGYGGRADDDNPGSLRVQSQWMEAVVYFADREAIEREFVKVMWLDAYGNCLRITKMAPSALTGIRCMWQDGYSMEEAVMAHGIRDGGSDDDGNDEDEDDDAKSSKKPNRINKKSADYEAGYEAGYDAGVKDGYQAVQYTQDAHYDVGYSDAKKGLHSRTGH